MNGGKSRQLRKACTLLVACRVTIKSANAPLTEKCKIQYVVLREDYAELARRDASVMRDSKVLCGGSH